MKRDNITKLNIKLRIELFMVCMVLIFTFFVGCTSNGEEGKVDPKSEETLESPPKARKKVETNFKGPELIKKLNELELEEQKDYERRQKKILQNRPKIRISL